MKFFAGFKKIVGGILVLAGLILHLIPLFPAGWIIVLGLELLGVRLLLQDKMSNRLSKTRFAGWIKFGKENERRDDPE